MTIYHYGRAAWVWRALIAVGLAVYVDLLATIPDHRRFHEALRLARP